MIERSNDRIFSPDYSGDILMWDIDKTYLDTRFSSLRGLLTIPFEFAIDKTAIAGAAPLLRGLRHGAGPRNQLVPLYFVSGSPPQLRRVIERRMMLDGVDYDGITFKDQWRLLRTGRIDDIRYQMGYKLLSLLLYWQELPKQAQWWCFGDDVEVDAEAFVLFGEVCAGYRGHSLRARLQRSGATRQLVNTIMALVSGLPIGNNPVRKVFIHLERQTSLNAFAHPKMIPTYSYLQTALYLCQQQKITTQSMLKVAQELRLRHLSSAAMAFQLQDAQDRLGVAKSWCEWVQQI